MSSLRTMCYFLMLKHILTGVVTNYMVMETGGSMPHSQLLWNSPYPELILIHFYVLNLIYLSSILILPSHLHLGLPKGLFLAGVPDKILIALVPSSILATWCTHLSLLHNHSDYIRWTVQTMKFLIVEPSPLPIWIPLGPKYLPQDPVFKYP